jgi:LPXTG-motif cell wall-anchored protein
VTCLRRRHGDIVRRGLTAAALVAVLAGTGVTSATAATPPERLTVSMTFTDVLPGVTQTQAASVDLVHRARVTDVELQEEGAVGAVVWAAHLCPPAGTCLDLMADHTVGEVLPAGAYRFVVSATGGTLGGGLATSLVGRVSVVRTDQLAMTGADGWATLAATGLALAAAGVLLVALARRRRDDEHDQHDQHDQHDRNDAGTEVER